MTTKTLSCATSILLIAGVFFPVSETAAQRSEMTETEIRGHTMYTLMAPGDIPAIFKPEFIPVAEAATLYRPSEPLIVVVDGAVARGYSTWHLDHHEVVNDYINEHAITVTW